MHSEPQHSSSRTVKVIDIPLPRSQDTAVIVLTKSNERKQNYEILMETPMEKRLQRSDEKLKMKRRAEDIKQSKKKRKSSNKQEEIGHEVGK